MKKYRLLLWGLVVFLSFFQVAFAKSEDAGKYTLRFHPVEGSSYCQKDIMELGMTMEAEGVKVDMLISMGIGYTFDIEKVEKNGTSWSRMTYNSINFNMSMLGNETKYDSTDVLSPASPFMLYTGGIIGESFRLKINEMGQIKKVDGLKEIAKSVAGRATISDEKLRREVENNLYKDYKQSMKSPTDRVVGLYPKKPVAVGESWNSTSKFSSNNMEIEVENTYTLSECSNGIATITVNSPLKSKNRTTLPSGGELVFTSGKMAGVIKMDLATGWIIRTDLKLEFQGVAKNGGYEFPFSINGKTVSLPFDEEIGLEIGA